MVNQLNHVKYYVILIMLRAQWPFATYLYIAGLWAYLQKNL